MINFGKILSVSDEESTYIYVGYKPEYILFELKDVLYNENSEFVAYIDDNGFAIKRIKGINRNTFIHWVTSDNEELNIDINIIKERLLFAPSNTCLIVINNFANAILVASILDAIKEKNSASITVAVDKDLFFIFENNKYVDNLINIESLQRDMIFKIVFDTGKIKFHNSYKDSFFQYFNIEEKFNKIEFNLNQSKNIEYLVDESAQEFYDKLPALKQLNIEKVMYTDDKYIEKIKLILSSKVVITSNYETTLICQLLNVPVIAIQTTFPKDFYKLSNKSLLYVITTDVCEPCYGLKKKTCLDKPFECMNHITKIDIEKGIDFFKKVGIL